MTVVAESNERLFLVFGVQQLRRLRGQIRRQLQGSELLGSRDTPTSGSPRADVRAVGRIGRPTITMPIGGKISLHANQRFWMSQDRRSRHRDAKTL
ncbi:hypothetical protein B9Z55_020282 [Caenorhabditis nigoni]|uniref:Uncharacterized protein n=1 Tax=Caenorhabditis nigoni TaxID=1611254 RepID=A0A2G5TM40_9PELO|nr:hypothetical protein B9Z55_020282 [Caenorhabditis nigoni]